MVAQAGDFSIPCKVSGTKDCIKSFCFSFYIRSVEGIYFLLNQCWNLYANC